MLGILAIFLFFIFPSVCFASYTDTTLTNVGSFHIGASTQYPAGYNSFYGCGKSPFALIPGGNTAITSLTIQIIPDWGAYSNTTANVWLADDGWYDTSIPNNAKYGGPISNGGTTPQLWSKWWSLYPSPKTITINLNPLNGEGNGNRFLIVNVHNTVSTSIGVTINVLSVTYRQYNFDSIGVTLTSSNYPNVYAHRAESVPYQHMAVDDSVSGVNLFDGTWQIQNFDWWDARTVPEKTFYYNLRSGIGYRRSDMVYLRTWMSIQTNSNATQAYNAALQAKASADNASTQAATAVNQTWYTGTYGGSQESVANIAGYIRILQL